MRINVAIPEAHVDAPVLDAALESVTRLNESLLERGEVPSFQRALHHGIKWRPEPPGAEHFDNARTVTARGWGDCDDLAPYEAASIRHSGEDPGARAIVQRSGPKSWHAVVEMSDGSIRDPSKRAGMAPGIAHGVRGATLPLMYPPSEGVNGSYIVRPQIALRPMRGAYQARADLPWNWREHLEDESTAANYALTALHTAPVASTALTGAIDGLLEIAEINGTGDEEHIASLEALADCVQGASLEELTEEYGEAVAERAHAVVGSFFGKLARGAKSLARGAMHNPLTNAAASFVPGGSAALHAAQSLEHRLMPGQHPSAHPAIATAPSFPGPLKTFGTYRMVFE